MQPRQSQTSTQTTASINEDDFTFESIIGCGAGGRVNKATYHGSDARIRNLGSIVVKSGQIANDITITNFLNRNHEKQELDDLRSNINIGVVAKYANMSQVLVLPLIRYTQGVEPDNLKSFLEKRFFAGRICKTNINDENPFGDHLIASALCEIFQSMKNAQDALHSVGVMHLDTSCRNFIVAGPYSVVIADFGLSRVIPAEGWINTGTDKMPLICMDKQVHMRRQASILTDFYSLRVSMMEAIALSIGVNLYEEILKATGPNDVSKQVDTAERERLLQGNLRQYAKNRRNMEDTAALSQIFDLLKDKLKNCPDIGFKRKQQIVQLLTSFQKYFTQLPENAKSSAFNVNGAIQTMRDQDMKMFQEALAAYKLKAPAAKRRASVSLFDLNVQPPTVSTPIYEEDTIATTKTNATVKQRS